MKVDKILRDMVKAYLSDKQKFNITYNYNLDDKNVYIAVNVIMLYVIPKDRFILDIEKIFSDKEEFTGAKRLFDSAPEAKPLTYLYDKEIFKKSASIYELDGVKIGLDKKLLKSFEDGNHELTLKSTKYNAPVFIYDYDALLGLLMPIKIKE
jgi:hypothetical protein